VILAHDLYLRGRIGRRYAAAQRALGVKSLPIATPLGGQYASDFTTPICITGTRIRTRADVESGDRLIFSNSSRFIVYARPENRRHNLDLLWRRRCAPRSASRQRNPATIRPEARDLRSSVSPRQIRPQGRQHTHHASNPRPTPRHCHACREARTHLPRSFRQAPSSGDWPRVRQEPRR
jgi:hypothetical protein